MWKSCFLTNGSYLKASAGMGCTTCDVCAPIGTNAEAHRYAQAPRSLLRADHATVEMEQHETRGFVV
jgi:hypothetical protein